MTETTKVFAWRFGGPLADAPPSLAWSILAGIGLLGLAWIVLSYRRTLVQLAPAARHTLTGLRLLLWLGVLLALAGPTRLERTTTQRETRPLAVLVDQSASMTTPDNRRQRRADEALRRWRALAPAAARAHGEPRAFAFADTPAPVPLAAAELAAAAATDKSNDATAAGSALGGSLPADQTRLFDSLDRLLASAPPGGWGGVVTLTDGLDTVATAPAESLGATARAALAVGTPLYFLAGKNRASSGPLLAFRDLSLPAQVPPRSVARLEVTVDSYQNTGRTVPLRLRVGETWRDLEPLDLEPGRRALVRGVDIPVEAPGVVNLELRAGLEPAPAVARAELRVAAPTGLRVLYYQGALDWGYRFLSDILRRDPAFSLTPVFNLAPDSPLAGRATPRSSAGALPALPDTAAGLAGYDIVIIANARAGQFTDAQQSALSSWVRAGGILLFLAPDDAAARGFAGTELEKMLPVVFLAPSRDASGDFEVEQFRAQMRSTYGGSDRGVEQGFAERAARQTRVAPLHAFSWETSARTLLGEEIAAAAPLFANYARVRRAKPGAEVLARHPRERGGEGDEKAILLALQRYGKGRSVALTSDALWRWKLRQASKDRDVERFWQNLLAWLGRESVRGPRLERAPLEAGLNRDLVLRVAGASPLLTLQAELEAPASPARPSGGAAAPADASVAPAPIQLTPAGFDGEVRLFRFTPPAAGLWRVTGRELSGDTALLRHWLNVRASPTGEASGLPPDEALLRDLADRTGGALLGDTPPPAWLAAASADESTLLRERREPLWHAGWIFAALLALYVAELILRRRWRLL